MKKIVLTGLWIVVAATMFYELGAMKMMEYKAGSLRIELQFRPWSLPTDHVTPANLNKLNALTKKYAIIIWTPGDQILETIENDSLDFLLDRIVVEVKTRFNRDIPRYDPTGSKFHAKIVNGEVVIVP